MEVQGQIIVINNTETIGAKGFRRRVAVVKTDEQYPQTIPVEFTQDKVSLLDNFMIGDIVKIGINLRGTEWKGRYFANIQGWQISKGEREKSAGTFMPDRDRPIPQMNGDMANQFNKSQEFDDDLPF